MTTHSGKIAKKLPVPTLQAAQNCESATRRDASHSFQISNVTLLCCSFRHKMMLRYKIAKCSLLLTAIAIQVDARSKTPSSPVRSFPCGQENEARFNLLFLTMQNNSMLHAVFFVRVIIIITHSSYFTKLCIANFKYLTVY